MTAQVALVEVTRRDQRSGRELVESSHAGTVVVVDGAGEIVWSIGDPERLTFARSVVKPFQAAACLELLGDEAGELTDEEVAIAWASHRAEPRHLAAVDALLRRAATSPDDLTCPPATGEHDSDAPAERRRYNCSGKHAMFALAGRCVDEHGPALVDPDWRLQRHVLSSMERWLGPAEAVAVDGCGAPAIAIPLVALARGYRRLPTEPVFGPVVRAGLAHPGLVGGEGRAESALLASGVVAKPGAEGVFGLAFTDDRGRALAAAIKIEDGAGRAASEAAVALVRACGGPSVHWTSPEPMGGGMPQGHVRASEALLDVGRAIGATSF
jgi:L-asparaginase II